MKAGNVFLLQITSFLSIRCDLEMHQLFTEGAEPCESVHLRDHLNLRDNSSAAHCMQNMRPKERGSHPLAIRVKAFSLQAKALSKFYDLVTSHFHLSDLFGGPLDHHASPVFNKSFCPMQTRNLCRFIYTIQPDGFLTAEPGE